MSFPLNRQGLREAKQLAQGHSVSVSYKTNSKKRLSKV